MLDETRLTIAMARRTLFQIGFGRARYDRLLGSELPSLPRVVRTGRAWWRLKHAGEADHLAELRAWRQAGDKPKARALLG